MEIDDEILVAYGENNIEELANLLKETTIDRLRKCITSHVVRNKSGKEPLRILRAIFRGTIGIFCLWTYCSFVIHDYLFQDADMKRIIWLALGLRFLAIVSSLFTMLILTKTSISAFLIY